jgi:hypothetical protein
MVIGIDIPGDPPPVLHLGYVGKLVIGGALERPGEAAVESILLPPILGALLCVAKAPGGRLHTFGSVTLLCLHPSNLLFESPLADRRHRDASLTYGPC